MTHGHTHTCNAPGDACWAPLGRCIDCAASYYKAHPNRDPRREAAKPPTPSEAVVVRMVAFESRTPDRGFTVRASYLNPPDDANALIEMFKDGSKYREFLFPSYKIWNIAAHFEDIVDEEISKLSPEPCARCAEKEPTP